MTIQVPKRFNKWNKKKEGKKGNLKTPSSPTSFKPLPSDIIQDPEMWNEWELNENYQVVCKAPEISCKF